MSARDDDIIEFDFFDDEPETEQSTQRRPALRPRTPRDGGGGPPRRPTFRGPQGITPLLRLVLLIALAIFVLIVLVFWVQSCRSDSKTNAYKDYMDDMGAVAKSSEDIFRDLNEQLTTPGIRQADLVQSIQGLTSSQEQVVRNAETIDPPGPLREEHDSAVEALQFRVSGLNGLAGAFQRLSGTADSGDAGALLAAQAERLVASDVIWDDLYRIETEEVLRQQAVLGVTVPDSNFLEDPELATTAGMRPVVNRIRGATTGGRPTGKHGNGITQVRALPDGTVLDEDADNTVTLTPGLQIEVTVENSGDSQEVQVPVRLTLQQSGGPITKTRVVNVIDPGQQRRVVFGDFDRAQIGQQTQLKVEVKPVQGETNTANNARQYAVTFLFTPAE